MNDDDDPVSLLNLTRETAAAPGRPGGWWLASILSLVCFGGLGFLVALGLPRVESDWFGIRFLVAILGGVIVGAILCVAFAVVSLAKGERGSPWAALVATPCLLGLIAAGAGFGADLANQARAKSAHTARLEASARIRTDPGIVLREHWDKSGNSQHYVAFRESFSDPQVRYTMPLLQQIYDEAPGMRDYLFQHPACTPEFLAAHFQEAYDRCPRISYVMLASIVAHPNTPLALVERVAQSPQLPVGAVNPAKAALQKRAPDTRRP